MSSDTTNMSWLHTDSLKSVAAHRFAEFCQKDIETYDDSDDPDKTLYREAAAMILQRIEQAVSGEVK